jgi:hypothetical protein
MKPLSIRLLPLLAVCVVGLMGAGVACGNIAYHSLFIKSDGSLWAMGKNDLGQLGAGNTTDKTSTSGAASSPTALEPGELVFLKPLSKSGRGERMPNRKHFHHEPYGRHEK